MDKSRAAHIAFCNDDKDIEDIVLSLKYHGNIELVYVLSDIPRSTSSFTEYSGTFLEYRTEMIDTRNYNSMLNQINTAIAYCKNMMLEPLVNITHATPMQAYAVRMATITNPAKVYAVVGKELIEVEELNIPQYISVSAYGMQILKQLHRNIDGLTRSNILVLNKRGHNLSNTPRVEAFRDLHDLGLIEFVKGPTGMKYDGSTKSGPRAEICRLTDTGKQFCTYNKQRLDNIILKEVRQ